MGTTGTQQARVVAVIGSPHRRGSTEQMVEATVAELESCGVSCEIVRLAELSVAPCLGHDDCASRQACHQRDDAEDVLTTLFAADGLILASPVYFQSVSAQMKALIDRSFFQYCHGVRLRARAVGLMAVGLGSGIEGAFDVLQRFVTLSSDRDIQVLTAGGFVGPAGRAAEDQELMADARRLGRDLAEALA